MRSSSISSFSCATVKFATIAGLAANLVLGLAGCARGIPDAGLTASDTNVDRSISTSSLQERFGPERPNPLGLENDTYLDGETIANAVSAVKFSGNAIAWQNPATGSSGDITGVIERKATNGTLCRDFSALRASYDGIRNYTGSACMSDAGAWRLTAFQPI